MPTLFWKLSNAEDIHRAARALREGIDPCLIVGGQCVRCGRKTSEIHFPDPLNANKCFIVSRQIYEDMKKRMGLG